MVHSATLMRVSEALDRVRDFHKQIGESIATQPQLLPGSRTRARALARDLRSLLDRYPSVPGDTLFNRARLSIEELEEWIVSHEKENLVSALDALADRFFALLGDAIATGLPLETAFAIVAQSNLTKATRTPDGKAVKGAAYRSPTPDLQHLLEKSTK